ncbi:MAG TPA: diguanylate cyclase [Pyrinomonadaceae bacterium]|nr:diguanylate cyclase [Pyrinomonadaceae bacterium]
MTETARPLILVADDEAINRQLIQRRLEREGYRVLTARDGGEAVRLAREELPDLVILDVMMPGMDGLDACRALKEDERTRDIPIIFLSARDETEMKVSGLGLGADDYISKPFEAAELVARVHVRIRLKRERDQLRTSAEEAAERAMTDALTGLLNRHALTHTLARESAEARRYTRPLSCLMVDLDDFKTINDTYGHATGDRVLRQIAAVLREAVRGTDTVFRYGGEEFLVLLPETDLAGAGALGEKIRAAVEGRLFGQSARAFDLTLSIGVASLSGDESGNDMIARADTALYRAKKRGRNRVETLPWI